jgi:hypothetical protein
MASAHETKESKMLAHPTNAASANGSQSFVHNPPQ